MVSFERRHIRAPELYGDFWFNSGPISISAMRGSIILIDFWDYSRSDCQRTIPYLKEWNRKYRDFGFIVIGVHTPQFKFGRSPENVEKAIRHTGVDYPIVTDNDALIWSSYGNRFWPTKYLIDRDGFFWCMHSGEGGYEQMERAIQFLLIEAGNHGELPLLMDPLRDTDYPGVVCYRPTGEIHLGYLRGTMGNPEGFNPESTLLYEDRGIHVSGRFYLNGKWFNEREFVRFDGKEGETGHVALRYEAIEANVVMDVEAKRSGKVYVFQDGQPLTAENAGSDISFEKFGKSFVVVDGPRMFNLVRNKEFTEHELKLVTPSMNTSLYAFSFVTGVIPELISRN